MTSTSSSPEGFSGKSFRSSSASVRYNGMINESFYKKFRNNLFHLFDYISTEASPMIYLQNIMSILRVYQLIIPSLCIGYSKIYIEGTVLYKTMSIISVPAHIIPVHVRDQYSIYFLYGYFVFFIIFYLFLAITAIYFKKNARLPKIIPNILYAIICSLGYYLHPIAAQFTGEIIGQMISQTNDRINEFNIAAVVLTIMVIVSYMYIFSQIYSLSITFRHDSLTTIVPEIQSSLCFIILLLTFVSALASKISYIPRILLTFLVSLGYLSSPIIYLSKGGFVSVFHLKAISATTLTGGVSMSIVGIIDILNQESSDVLVGIYVGGWIVAYILVSFIIKCRAKKALSVLDLYQDDPYSIESIKTASVFCDTIITGFRSAHPACLSFRPFKCAIDKWPKAFDIWLIFAKFTAIYPEETQQLEYIIVGMQQNKVHGSLAKHTIRQIESIIMQREQNLIPELKNKIDLISKHVLQIKAKLRYIWDLALQGNTNELESIIGRAYDSVQKTNTEYIHLLSRFPNNRFVVRSYARYVKEVICDSNKSAEWGSKVLALQRGQRIADDHAQTLGLRAFPNLPENLRNQKPIQTINMPSDEMSLFDLEDEERTSVPEIETKQSIKTLIDDLVIPTYKYARIIHIILLIILFIIPAIGIFIGLPLYINDISSSISQLFSLTKCKTLLFMSMSFMSHYIGENINYNYSDLDPNFPGQVVFPFLKSGDLPRMKNIDPPESLNGMYETIDWLLFQLKSLSATVTELSHFKTFKVHDKEMENVRVHLFDPSNEFKHISNPIYQDCWTYDSQNESCIEYTVVPEKLSVFNMVSQYIVLMSEIVNTDIDISGFSLRPVSTSMLNIRTISNELTYTAAKMLDYIDSIDKKGKLIFTIVMVLVVCLVTFLYSIILFMVLKKLQRDKTLIYKCLTSLPKNVVSHVAEQFRILRKEEADSTKSTKGRDEEVSKQEENLLKLFSSTTDVSEVGGSDTIHSFVSTILLIALHIALTIVVCINFQQASNQLNESAPHIDHLMSAFSYDICAIFCLHLLPGSVHPNINFNIYGYTKERIAEIVTEWQVKSLTEYTYVRYGDYENGKKSFEALGININSDDGDDDDHNECEITDKIESFHDVYKCLKGDTLLSYSQMIVQNLLNLYLHTDNHQIFSGQDEYLNNLWYIYIYLIYDGYYYQMFTKIQPMLEQSMSNRIPKVDLLVFVFAFLGIITVIYYLIILSLSEKKTKFALSLLLQCKGKHITENNYITSILSGNFQMKIVDMTSRDCDFYDCLVDNMPDSIMILNNHGDIVSANISTSRVYDIPNDQLVGHSINTIGGLFKDENPFSNYFDPNVITTKKNFTKNTYFIKTSTNEEVHLELHFCWLQEEGFLVSINITQTVMYNKLITEEKYKSDQLLGSILPSKLVSRVQSGEKNISFAVQSATIVFMDIVSFTPWCGSLPAATVMKTLNILFKEFDSLAQIHSTMTKIKCIGDCYMAAGGIFMVVNQPNVHAKDVVDFGLDAIESLQSINEKIQQDLKIRVGINSGGPIVAGVLGTEKPTFEILGPTINMAQQMEHHGVPMKVHASRSVYELIYGGHYDVHERGEINLKNEKAVTYIVEKKL
ncbi:Adenylate and Guanylate cyclase catalytic domain containing protein [Tritrichomonas foetus]|uniref:Adenylate and Guanylate cyclase catalytic domain containing protein n=1 Tax=Tritrichomonas foetus TaxID=1144522 RepID=A0A1J4KI38_9EUKA|nr:Adenylate and Guanylate cyclase catalytic domain containing protein [Tritrichomonas foetus]|eukprot:OHT10600.1 Adenylate and Guanylate cyclase catalytic domain containing protein [Tritrichomonas foetus]